MTKFAFINHYLDTSFFLEMRRSIGLGILPPTVAERLMPHLPPHKILNLGPLTSKCGATTEGIGIMCPFLPRHFATLSHKVVLQKILKAIRIAQRYGADIVGLGGLTSVCCDEGAEIRSNVTCNLTSGNTFTAYLSIVGVIGAAELMGISLKNARLAVIGATGDIGSICTRVLAKRVKTISIAARNEHKLINFADTIRAESGVEICVAKYVSEAILNADIILSATSAITTIVEPEYIKTGAIICDVGYPANVTRHLRKFRKDVFVFEGGLARPPQPKMMGEKILRRFGPVGTIHGCFAETILLALEGVAEDFSLGRGRITTEKINRVKFLSDKHGFTLAPFSYAGETYSRADIEQIRREVVVRKETAVSMSSGGAVNE